MLISPHQTASSVRLSLTINLSLGERPVNSPVFTDIAPKEERTACLFFSDISEIRVEEVQDNEEGKHFFRIYFYYKNGNIKIIAESKIKPTLVRYVSKIF